MLTSAGAGLLTGFSLIIAIGAQNAFVLRQGLARQHVTVVVAICAISDLVLILAGVGGIGVVVESAPGDRRGPVDRRRLPARRTASCRCSRRGGLTTLEAARQGPRRWPASPTALALTWLNPHVYLDTVLLLGSIANTYDQRWWFGAGASVGSLLWFGGLGYGARLAHGLLSSPRAWQVLDVLIGLTMLAIAVVLATG